MKILVMSDSHGAVENMEEIVRKEQPDLIYHLGDYIRDSEWLQRQFFHIPLIGVVGNCDYGNPGPEQLLDEAEGVRIFGCHGHKYNVKYGLMRLCYAAQEKDVSLCLFGHTHVPFLEEIGDITFMNPGACNTGNPSYGLVMLEDGQFACSLHRLLET